MTYKRAQVVLGTMILSTFHPGRNCGVNRPRREHDVVNTDARGCVIETNSIIARLGKMRFSTRSRLLASVNQPSAAEVTHHA